MKTIQILPQEYKFTPNWLTGFTQADGSFLVGFGRKQKGLMPYRIQPQFILAQTVREIKIIKALHKYLGVGQMRVNRNSVYIEIVSLRDILSVVIPHFDQYPVRGEKQLHYTIFRQVVFAIHRKRHLNPKGFLQILNTCYFMNSSSRRTKESYQKIIRKIQQVFGTIENPLVLNISSDISFQHKPLHKDYVAGLIDGDGSINFSFYSGKIAKVVPNLTVISDMYDHSVLLELCSFFGCGQVYTLQSKSARFQVKKTSDFLHYVLPFFDSVNLHSIKRTFLSPSIEAWRILASRESVSSIENLRKVVDLVYNLNQEGKYRHITAYLEQITKSPLFFMFYSKEINKSWRYGLIYYESSSQLYMENSTFGN